MSAFQHTLFNNLFTQHIIELIRLLGLPIIFYYNSFFTYKFIKLLVFQSWALTITNLCASHTCTCIKEIIYLHQRLIYSSLYLRDSLVFL